MGNRGTSSQKSGGGAGQKTAAEIQAEIDEKRNTEAIYPTASWSGIEKKVLYRVSFTNASGKTESLTGFISKGALISEMKALGATPEQVKKAQAGLKKINPAYYKK